MSVHNPGWCEAVNPSTVNVSRRSELPYADGSWADVAVLTSHSDHSWCDGERSLNCYGGCENSEVTDPSWVSNACAYVDVLLGVTTTVEELMLRLGAIYLAVLGGSGPDRKRNTGRTNDLSVHPCEDLTYCCYYYECSIPGSPHVRSECPASVSLYDEAAYGKGLSSGKTFGDCRW